MVCDRASRGDAVGKILIGNSRRSAARMIGLADEYLPMKLPSFPVHFGRHSGLDLAHVEGQVLPEHGTSQVSAFRWRFCSCDAAKRLKVCDRVGSTIRLLIEREHRRRRL